LFFNILLGFASTSEARHVAEITNKLANFVIETDTEASIMPTDAGIVHIYWKIQAPFVNVKANPSKILKKQLTK
jgi:hypothetical protein